MCARWWSAAARSAPASPTPGQGRLDRHRAARARRADLRLHLARRRPPAALQHGLRHQPHPRPLGEALQGAGGRDRPQRRLLGGRQPAHGADPRADGRVPALRLHRRDRRHPLRVADARRRSATAGRSSAPRTSRARSSTRPTATSTPPTSPRRWPRAPGRWASRSCARRRSTATPGPARSGSSPAAIMADRGGNLVPTEETFEVRAEHVVTATGNHAQRTARLLGIRIPAIPVEHQYIVTEPDPALVEFRKSNPEHPVLRDADAKWYVREERGGWILGPYEQGAPARFEYAVPDSFRADLFPLDLERIETEYLSMIHRIPSSESVGLKDDFNGPICYTPDGNPLVGPAPGLRNLWLAEGFSFGITAAGGTGHYLAQMMTDGEAEIDMASLDPQALRRLDDHRIRRAQERGVLRPRLRPPPPRRGARGLPPAPHRPLLRPGEGPRRPVRPGQRLRAPDLLRPAGLRRPRRPQLPPRRLVALRRRGGEGDPRERRPDRRHRLRQARGARAPAPPPSSTGSPPTACRSPAAST